jgi:hypothetical protein
LAFASRVTEVLRYDGVRCHRFIEADKKVGCRELKRLLPPAGKRDV